MINKFSIYLITPQKIDLDTFSKKFEEALNTGHIGYAQIRLKDCSVEIILDSIQSLLKISKKYEVPLLINDRPDLAKISGTNGVHLGQSDVSALEARKILGAKSIIGITCHDSINLACNAANSGANYVAFGAFFKSSSKKTNFIAEPSILEWWSKISNTPSVAIGGINQKNFKDLLKKGANYIAAISSIWDHPKGPASAINEYIKEISNSNI